MVRIDNSTSEDYRKDASGRIDTHHLILEWAEAPWDTAVFNFPVLQITKMELLGPSAVRDFRTFEAERDRMGSGLVSSRLAHECLQESMFLEERGFRFIEMLYQPVLEDLKNQNELGETGLYAVEAENKDLAIVMDMAGSVFSNERFHIDPRLNRKLGDQRYRNWVRSCIDHPTQTLYVVHDGNEIVAFFVTEMMPDQTCYWHLTAVANHAQGRGYGKRTWNTMLHLARKNGATRVQTCIVARNNRVLNLYARLGFRFPPPLMTFHWVKSLPS